MLQNISLCKYVCHLLSDSAYYQTCRVGHVFNTIICHLEELHVLISVPDTDNRCVLLHIRFNKSLLGLRLVYHYLKSSQSACFGTLQH